ncbi:MAG: glycosyltransferase [Chitinophagaceae bacterium]
MGKNNYIYKVLVAPLDWGLGHTTRCIPVIRALQNAAFEVVIAGTPVQMGLLKKEFPGILNFPLKGYNVHYSKQKSLLPLKILSQVPKILNCIYAEKKWLKKLVKEEKIDLVIADNRFGLSHPDIPCVFITHQLEIKMPSRFLQKLVQKMNYRFINKFSLCWVPDFEGEKNIAGDLSHPKMIPRTPLRYIGPLSRFEKTDETSISTNWLFLISGPEPQRSLLENKVLSSIQNLPGKSIVLLGKPGKENQQQLNENCTVINHLNTKKLEKIIRESEYIICRSGYTSVMEILSLGKKSIMIPTSGQSEQEYLAKHLSEQKWCIEMMPNEDLASTLEKAKTFEYIFPVFTETSMQKFVEELIDLVKKVG